MSVGRTKEGTYYYSVWYMNENNVRKQKKQESVKWKSKKDAREAEMRFLASLQIKSNESLTYNELQNRFINEKRNRCKPRTITTYEETHKFHIMKQFGEKFVNEITTNDILEWQSKLLVQGYKNSYLKTLQENFKRVLNWGVKHDYIKNNPFKCETAKRQEFKKEMEIYTPDEFKKLYDSIDDFEWKIIFQTLYWTGIRKGELMALRFCDVDIEGSAIKISKTYDTRNHLVTPPKTNNSNRIVDIPYELTQNLEQFINQKMKTIGYNKNLFLFGMYRPIASTTLDNRNRKYSKKAGLKQIRIHDYRHSHVSLLINEKVDDFVISKRLGHTRDMVNNTYGHLFKDKGKEIINTLNTKIESLNKISNEKVNKSAE